MLMVCQDTLPPELHSNTYSIEKKELQATLAPWTGPDAPGCKRATGGPQGFSVKFVSCIMAVSQLERSC